MSDHDQLIAACARWERLYNERCEEVERLTAENARLEAFHDCHTAECYGCPCCDPAAASVLPGEPQ